MLSQFTGHIVSFTGMDGMHSLLNNVFFIIILRSVNTIGLLLWKSFYKMLLDSLFRNVSLLFTSPWILPQCYMLHLLKVTVSFGGRGGVAFCPLFWIFFGSAPALTHHDARDLRLICLVKKCNIKIKTFLSYNAFVAKYNMKTNYLEYFKVIAALKQFKKVYLTPLDNPSTNEIGRASCRERV